MTHDVPLVLVVDDRPNMLQLMQKVLRADARVATARGGREAIAFLEREPVDVVLCDLKMPDVDGLEVLKASRRLRPKAEFVLMTAYATVDTAVGALRLGAYDYITKPFEPEEARAIVLRALGRVASRRGEGQGDQELPGVTGRSEAARELAAFVRRIAASDATVLLLGETGTGKERVARAIHHLSKRSERRCVVVNCAAIPGELLESELFGYVRGAFTGANRDKAGLFEEASGGTLFLDEIGEMPLALQAKLTRALEERAVRRLGDSNERNVDVRLLAATHRDIETMVGEGTFREDLWYRLNVALVQVPPLRARRDDIEALAVRFLREFGQGPGKEIQGFTTAALEALEAFEWPGNVRQLRAAVERACAVSPNERVDVGDLPPEVLRQASVMRPELADLPWSQAIEQGRADTAQAYLREVLARHDGKVAEAAAHAGVERESFYRLIRKYGVQPELYRAPRGKK